MTSRFTANAFLLVLPANPAGLLRGFFGLQQSNDGYDEGGEQRKIEQPFDFERGDTPQLGKLSVQRNQARKHLILPPLRSPQVRLPRQKPFCMPYKSTRGEGCKYMEILSTSMGIGVIHAREKEFPLGAIPLGNAILLN